jgi:PAS domain S-box-containing protein
VRVWRKLSSAADVQPPPQPAAGAPDALPIECLADGVLLVDSGDRITAANQAFLSLYGIESAADISGRSFESIYRRAWASQWHRTEFRRSLEALKDNQRFSGAPYEVALPGGRWVRVIEHRAGAAAGRGCFVHIDITNLKRQEHALRQAEATARRQQALYRLLCESSSDVTLAVAGGEIVYASPSVSRVLGWQPEDLVGRAALGLMQAGDGAGAWEDADRGHSVRMTDYRVQVRRPDGSRLWMDARARPTQPLDEELGRETVVITLRRPAVDPHNRDAGETPARAPGRSGGDAHWAT